MLVLVPSEVDGVPYTLNKLGELIQSRFPENVRGYHIYDSDIQNQLGSVSPQAPYWLLMTRSILPGSMIMSYPAQDDLLADRARETGIDYRIPSVLEAATAILAHYVRSGERLFPGRPWTYTRCQDSVTCGNVQYPISVGGFESSGLTITYLNYDYSDGVAVCRKFF